MYTVMVYRLVGKRGVSERWGSLKAIWMNEYWYVCIMVQMVSD